MDASRRPLIPIGLLGVGLILGLLLGRSGTTPTMAPSDLFIKVGPNANQVSGAAKPEMSRAAGHQATWKSTTDKPLTIYFVKKALPLDKKNLQQRPFAVMNETTDNWVVQALPGNPQWSFSGLINKDLNLSSDPKDPGLEFKYWQILDGVPADGKIIIKW